MKKMLFVGAIAIASLSAQAIPVGQVQATYSDIELNGARVLRNSYAELVILQSATAPTWANTLAMYNSVTVVRYTGDGALSLVDGVTTLGPTKVGYKADGTTTTSAGQIVSKWQYSSTAYAAGDWWIAVRYWNTTTKGIAGSDYGISSFTKITAVPAEPVIGSQTFTVSAKQSTTYQVPSVPEPATMCLFGLGGLALVIRRKMRKEA